MKQYRILVPMGKATSDDNDSDMRDDQESNDQQTSDDQQQTSDDQDSNDDQQEDKPKEPSTGYAVKNMIVKSASDTAKEYVNDLIQKNQGDNPSKPHRKILGNFFKHVINNYNSYPDDHKEKIQDSINQMADSAISGAKSMKHFVDNYDKYKDRTKEIMNDIKTLKSGDMTKKIDTVMKYKKYL